MGELNHLPQNQETHFFSAPVPRQPRIFTLAHLTALQSQESLVGTCVVVGLVLHVPKKAHVPSTQFGLQPGSISHQFQSAAPCVQPFFGETAAFTGVRQPIFLTGTRGRAAAWVAPFRTLLGRGERAQSSGSQR